MSDLTEGRCYSRWEISQSLGGSMQEFFPHKGGYVVCGCFRRDLNPGAPSEILAGNSDNIRRWARVFASQGEAVPIFLKQGPNHWEFVGFWRCVSISEDSAEIGVCNNQAGRDDVSMVLRLERAS